MRLDGEAFRADTEQTALSVQEDSVQGVRDLEDRYVQVQSELERVSALLEEFESDRMSILTIRDYAVGIEQAYGRALYEIDENRRHIGELNQQIADLHERLASSGRPLRLLRSLLPPSLVTLLKLVRDRVVTNSPTGQK